MAIEITDSNFEEIIQTDKPVVIDCWAEWCGPCRMVSPIIDEISEEYEGKAVVGKLDVDNNPTVTGKFKIRNIPTVLYIKNGEVVDKQVGSVPKKRFVAKLEAVL